MDSGQELKDTMVYLEGHQRRCAHPVLRGSGSIHESCNTKRVSIDRSRNDYQMIRSCKNFVAGMAYSSFDDQRVSHISSPEQKNRTKYAPREAQRSGTEKHSPRTWRFHREWDGSNPRTPAFARVAPAIIDLRAVPVSIGYDKKNCITLIVIRPLQTEHSTCLTNIFVYFLRMVLGGR